MQGSEAIKMLDEAIEKARENRLHREQKSWYERAKSEQDRIDAEKQAAFKYEDSKSYGFINGPLSQEQIDAFMRDWRLFDADQKACAECKDLNKRSRNAPARLMCSLHMGWGHGICWKRGS